MQDFLVTNYPRLDTNKLAKLCKLTNYTMSHPKF
jgi:hypothetical protein